MLFLIVILISFFVEGQSHGTSTKQWPNFSIQHWSDIDVILLLGVVLLFGVLLGMLLLMCLDKAHNQRTENGLMENTTVTENTSVSENTTMAESSSVTESTLVTENITVAGNTAVAENTAVTENTAVARHKAVTENTAVTERKAVSERKAVRENKLKNVHIEDAETVGKKLKKHYGSAGELTFYTPSNCVITRGQDDERISTSDEIFQEHFFQNSKRVLMIGEEGFGKTYLLQRVQQQWAKGNILNKVIIMYIRLDGLSKSSCIVEEVVNSMNGKIQSVEAIFNAMRQRDTLVLLDGLSHLKLENDSATKPSRNNTLTVGNLLNNELNSFPRLKVWATVRLNKSRISLFKTEYTSVNLNGFTEIQRKTHWKNTITDIDPSRVQDLGGNANPTESIETIWKDNFSIDSKVKKSPLLAHLLVLVTRGEMTKTDFVEKFSLSFSLADNVYVFWKLCKYWEIDYWCRKFERKDVVFDKGAPGYSEDLVKDVCTSCKMSGVTLGKLTFRGEFPPSTSKCLPDIETYLIFVRVKLQKEDHINILRLFEEKSVKIS